MATPSGVRGANTTSPDQYEALPSRCRRGHDVIVPGRNAICVAAAVILTACGAHTQSPSPQQVRLAMSLSPGTTYRYTVHTSGSMKSAQPGMAMTMAMDISMRQTYQVLSVDPAGVATVKVTVDQLAGKLGATSLPIPGTIPAFTVQIAKDGTVNGLGADQLGSMQAGLPFANPGPLGGIVPVVHLQGTTTGSITSWVEVSTGRLVKASGTSSSTISESVQGVPSPAAGAFGLGAGDSQMAETQSIVVSSVPE